MGSRLVWLTAYPDSLMAYIRTAPPSLKNTPRRLRKQLTRFSVRKSMASTASSAASNSSSHRSLYGWELPTVEYEPLQVPANTRGWTDEQYQEWKRRRAEHQRNFLFLEPIPEQGYPRYQELRRRKRSIISKGGILLEINHELDNEFHRIRVEGAVTASEAMEELFKLLDLYEIDCNIGGNDNAFMDALPIIRTRKEEARELWVRVNELTRRVERLL